MSLSRPDRKRQWFCIIAVALVCLMTLAGGMAMATEGGDDGAHGVEHAGGEAAHGDTHAGSESAHANHWKMTDTAKTLNFTVLAVILFLILRKFVPKALASRIDGIREQLADLEARKNAAETDLAKAKQKLAEMEKEAKQIVSDYVKQGEAAQERIMAEAQAAAAKLEEQAKKNIDHEFKAAKASLKAEIADMAMAQAESMIVAQIGDDDHDRLVNDYLAKVVA